MSLTYIALYILLSVLPVLIWLGYFYKIDPEREHKDAIVLSLFMGALLAFAALKIEIMLPFPASPFVIDSVYTFITAGFLVSLIEETAKFFSAGIVFVSHEGINRATSCMILAVSAGLGFAGTENFMALISGGSTMHQLIPIIILRFFSADVLHAVSAGIVGFFWGISFFEKHKILFILEGLFVASFLHAVYNYIIITIIRSGSEEAFLFLIALILFLLTLILFNIKEFKILLKFEQEIN